MSQYLYNISNVIHLPPEPLTKVNYEQASPVDGDLLRRTGRTFDRVEMADEVVNTASLNHSTP